jgi:putative FmdB family regulatory protein
MPIFEYICAKCDHRFEAIVLNGQKSQCPKCESKKLEQQLSRFAVGGEKAPSQAASACEACGSCGDPRGPGSCGVN